MIVSDASGDHGVVSLQELEKILVEASGEEKADDIWMSHDYEDYPALAILVKGGLACVHYFPVERDPGFLSLGNMSALERSRIVTFATGGASFEVPARSILPLGDALLVARDFFHSKELPRSIRWLRL